MTQDNEHPGPYSPPENHTIKPGRAGQRGQTRKRGKKTGPAAPAKQPACILITGKGSCPEWENLIGRYPMIDSVQREDFPEHGASFAYLAHFYRSENPAEESARAQEEFEAFFSAIGYMYDYSGNFESRWFEGIGVHISERAECGEIRQRV